MPRLTKRLLDAIEPERDETWIWDAEVKGFGLRVRPGGGMSFVLKYRAGMVTRRYTLGKVGSPHTCESARAEAKRLLLEVLQGRDPADVKAARRAEITVVRLVELYLSDGPMLKPNKKASSWATDRIVLLRHVVPLLGSRIASRITSEDVARMQLQIANGETAARQKGRPRGLARVTGGRRVAALTVVVLSGAYTFGINTGRLTANPCTGVVRLKSPPRERFLSEEEVGLIGEALDQLEAEERVNADMADAARMLMVTGARKSEICDLEWSWVDAPRRLLRLPDSKTGAKVIPLAPPALAILARRKRDASPYVFPAARGEGPMVGLPKAWRAVKVRANEIARRRALDAAQPVEAAPDLSDVRLHDLRHTFASFAVADGASLFLVGKVLGHRDQETTALYAHVRSDPVLAVAEGAAARVAAAMTRSAGAEVILLPARQVAAG